jgi:hypothetical protein
MLAGGFCNGSVEMRWRKPWPGVCRTKLRWWWEPGRSGRAGENGKATATLFAREGAKVLCADVSPMPDGPHGRCLGRCLCLPLSCLGRGEIRHRHRTRRQRRDYAQMCLRGRPAIGLPSQGIVLTDLAGTDLRPRSCVRRASRSGAPSWPVPLTPRLRDRAAARSLRAHPATGAPIWPPRRRLGRTPLGSPGRAG